MKSPTLTVILLHAAALWASAADMPWVEVAGDKKGFLLTPSGARFVPMGFNYDHDLKERRPAGDWLLPPFFGKSFVQYITLDPAGRERSAVAREWAHKLVAAVRGVDKRHLVTIGLLDLDWNQKGSDSGVLPEKIAPE